MSVVGDGIVTVSAVKTASGTSVGSSVGGLTAALSRSENEGVEVASLSPDGELSANDVALPREADSESIAD